MIHTLPVLLLAAGQSSRMRGTDKLMQSVDGRPLIRRQAELARSATRGPVIVTLPGEDHPRWAALNGLDVQRLAIPDAQEGMNASLRGAVTALPEEAPAAMVLLADLPDLTARDLKQIFDSVDLTSDVWIWRAATADGAPGHPVVFRAELFPTLRALTGDGGGKEAFAAAQGRVALVRLNTDAARTDLDTPEAWAAWRARNPDR